MPWLGLSRRNSYEGGNMKSTNLFSPSPLSPDPSVTFIPAMMDGSCGTSPTMQTKSSIQMIMMDMKVMMQNMMCIPEMMAPLMTMDAITSMCRSWVNMRDTGLQLMLCMTEISMILVVVPCFLVMPGVAFACMCSMFACAVMIMCWPLNGKRVLNCIADGKATENQDKFNDERWVFVNGAMTSHDQMRSYMIRLSKIFQRPITGIHNRTTGVVADMMCMMMANFLPTLNRSTSTVMYAHLRECLLNSSVRKVIVLSHGTGSQIMSMAIDRLHADLPIDVMQKMEIYTFGCAASHLSNPCLTLNSTMNPNPAFTRADGSLVSPVKASLAIKGNRMEDTERVIPHIEHYAISSDFFARCGIMQHTRSMLDNTFCGRQFIINSVPVRGGPSLSTKSSKSPGFLMSQYLDMLFPTSNPNISILNKRVAVDMQTTEKREFTAHGVSMQLKATGLGRRTASGSTIGSPTREAEAPMTTIEKRASKGAQMMPGSDSVEAARKSARDCQGRTVKQLSRLWMYTGGSRPVGEGVSMENGIGLGLNGMMGGG